MRTLWEKTISRLSNLLASTLPFLSRIRRLGGKGFACAKALSLAGKDLLAQRRFPVASCSPGGEKSLVSRQRFRLKPSVT